jgi:predicted aspartyl protease
MSEYPRIGVVVSVGDWVWDEEALPDTGFSGGIVVPIDVIEDISAPAQAGELRLGNDQVVQAPWWDGEVSIGDLSLRTTVWALGRDFIVGREVLDQLEICFYFGREVRLRFTE